MDRSLVIHYGTWWLLVAAIVALAVVMTLGARPVAAASEGCSVKNKATGQTYSTLQGAVTAAKPKVTLLARGNCHGKTVIGKHLTVVGVTTGGQRPALRRWGRRPLLVVKRGVAVRITRLDLRHRGNHETGLGINSLGTLTLRDVKVRDFDTGIRNRGRLALVGNTSIGLVYRGASSGVINHGWLVLGGTSRVNETVLNSGTVIMRQRSRIRHVPVRGSGGVAVVNRGRFEMRDASAVAHSAASPTVLNVGHFVMRGTSSIRDNWVGGVYGEEHGSRGGAVRNSGTFLMQDHSSVHRNEAEYDAVWSSRVGTGGGVHNAGTLRMAGSASVHDNTVAPDGQGGGIFNAKGGTLVGVRCGPGGNVYSNTPDDCHSAE